MKIYFAGSIRGGRDDAPLYFQIINELQSYGTVLTEHVGDSELTSGGEQKTAEYIFTRDVEWIREADVIVAEVTTASLGVGYELGIAEMLKKPILALYRQTEGKSLSAMVSGNAHITLKTYTDLDDAKSVIKGIVKEMSLDDKIYKASFIYNRISSEIGRAHV